MQMSVPDAAQRLGVSERRVRAMLKAGGLDGQKIGGRWIVNGVGLKPASRAPIRPLSVRSCWILIDAAAGERNPQSLSAVERHRLKDRISRLRSSPDPLPILRAWLAHRTALWRLRASPDDLNELRADSRLALSGVSHADAELLAGPEVEAYVAGMEAEDIVDDYLLVKPRPASSANVVLHVLEGRDSLPWNDVPLLAVAADLAERPGAREQNSARSLIRRTLADRTA